MSLPPYDLTATEPAQCELLASFIKCARPKIVVEAGTYLGHGAVWMGKALRWNGIGHLWTADPYDTCQAGLIADEKLDEWVTYCATDYLEMIEGMPPIDMAYIDASGPGHDASLRLIHLEATIPKLSDGGMIFVDDTKKDFQAWKDGEGGASRDRVRDLCSVNFEWLRGLSLYTKDAPARGSVP